MANTGQDRQCSRVPTALETLDALLKTAYAGTTGEGITEASTFTRRYTVGRLFGDSVGWIWGMVRHT